MAYTKWDSATVAAVTLSGSNLVATNTGTTSANQGAHAPALDGKSAGKFYIEATLTTIQANGANYGVGIGTTASSFTNMGNTATEGVMIYKSGNVWHDNLNLMNKGARSSGDIIGIALDLDNLGSWFRIAPSDIWNNSVSSNPATNTLPIAINAGTYIPFCTFGGTSGIAGNVITLNPGTAAFSGAVPSGFTSGWPIIQAGFRSMMGLWLGGSIGAASAASAAVEWLIRYRRRGGR